MPGPDTTFRSTPRTRAGGWPSSSFSGSASRRRERTRCGLHRRRSTTSPCGREIEGLAQAGTPTAAAADRRPGSPSLGRNSRAQPDEPTHGLTPRELDVLRLLGTGATNAEIGRALYMSPKTASVHVSAIIRKLGVTGRVQAATVAERMGLLAADTEGSRDRLTASLGRHQTPGLSATGRPHGDPALRSGGPVRCHEPRCVRFTRPEISREVSARTGSAGPGLSGAAGDPLDDLLLLHGRSLLSWLGWVVGWRGLRRAGCCRPSGDADPPKSAPPGGAVAVAAGSWAAAREAAASRSRSLTCSRATAPVRVG